MYYLSTIKNERRVESGNNNIETITGSAIRIQQLIKIF